MGQLINAITISLFKLSKKTQCLILLGEFYGYIMDIINALIKLSESTTPNLIILLMTVALIMALAIIGFVIWHRTP